MIWKRLKKKTDKEEEEFGKKIAANGGVGKKDIWAMILSALMIFVPVALVLLAVLCVVCLAAFGLF